MLLRFREAILAVSVSGLCLGMGATPARGDTVVFDEGHGQQFLVERSGSLDLSGLAAVFRDARFDVTTSKEEIDDAALSKARALVISGAFAPLTPAEIAATTRYVERGGRVCVMLHIGPPVAALLHRLGVAISNGVIRERENLIHADPTSFYVTDLGRHELTRGLERFAVFGGWALLNIGDRVEIVARTSAGAWVDLTGDRERGEGDAMQAFGVVVAGTAGSGRFAVFGDDAIFQNQFLTGGNVILARNLAGWLASGSEAKAGEERPREPAGGEGPHGGGT